MKIQILVYKKNIIFSYIIILLIMIEIKLYFRVSNFDYAYNYVLFIYLEDKVYYNIIDKPPTILKKKLSKRGFKYIKKFLYLSPTTRKEDHIIGNLTSKDSKWVKIIDIKY